MHYQLNKLIKLANHTIMYKDQATKGKDRKEARQHSNIAFYSIKQRLQPKKKVNLQSI